MTAATDIPRSEALAPKILRAGLYGRASKDPKKRGRSVEDQMTENRRTCEEHGWPIADEYVDLDRSASRHAKQIRKDFERMVADIEAGALDVIVSWESSRVQRDLEVYVKLRNLCMRTGTLWCYNGAIYDMRKRQDRLMTGLMAQMAEDEADGIQERNDRTVRLNAERGKPHAHCPFGYRRKYDPDDGHLIGQFPDPDTAPVVRTLFEGAAARKSTYALTEELRKHRPGAHRYGLRWMLMNPAYIGFRRHRGRLIAASWEPIVDADLFWKVQTIFEDPARRTSRDGRARHLMSGIGECGLCEDDPAAETSWLGIKWVKKVGRYACHPSAHVLIRAHLLDAYVERAVVQWLQSKAAKEAFEPVGDGGARDAAAVRLEALRGQMREAREMAAEFDAATGQPRLSVASLAQLEQQLLPRIEETELEVRRLAAVGDLVLDGLLGADDVREAWSMLSLEQKRHVLRKIVRVRLYKAAYKGARYIEPGRVQLTFFGDPAFVPHPVRKPGLRRVPQGRV